MSVKKVPFSWEITFVAMDCSPQISKSCANSTQGLCSQLRSTLHDQTARLAAVGYTISVAGFVHTLPIDRLRAPYLYAPEATDPMSPPIYRQSHRTPAEPVLLCLALLLSLRNSFWWTQCSAECWRLSMQHSSSLALRLSHTKGEASRRD